MRKSTLQPLVRSLRLPVASPHALHAPFFNDRRDAGRRMAAMFGHHDEGAATVVGVGRGGVVTAAEVARALDAPLDAVAVRKICHPSRPEVAIGAVAPGEAVHLARGPGLTDEQVANATARAQEEVVLLDDLLHAGDSPLDLQGRNAILVDDGIATGATMVAAARWARNRGADQVMVATPVASVEGLRLVLQVATKTLCLHTLVEFASVGQSYESFPSVDIDTVLDLIRENRARRR